MGDRATEPWRQQAGAPQDSHEQSGSKLPHSKAASMPCWRTYGSSIDRR